MYCKWCGMDSKDTGKCEWCGKPFVGEPGDQATTQMSPPTQPIPQATQAMSPQMTTVMPPVAPPASARPYSRANVPAPLKIEVPEIDPFGMRFEKYLAIMSLLLTPSLFAAHRFPDYWFLPFFAMLFFSGLFMGAFRVIGYYDDEFSDAMIVLATTYFLGPVFAVAGYLLVSLVRFSINTSILGLIASLLILRLAIGSAAHGLVDTVGYMTSISFAYAMLFVRFIQVLPVVVLFGGWMCASFTRPLNE